MSSRCLLNESVLQFAHFPLEGFDFLPAVERPFVVVAQTLHQAVLGLLDLGRYLVHLFALLEPLAQVHDFFADAVVGSIRFASGRLRVLLAPVVVERRAEVRQQTGRLAQGFGVGGRILLRRFGVGEGGGDGVELLCLRVANPLQVGSDAGLRM